MTLDYASWGAKYTAPVGDYTTPDGAFFISGNSVSQKDASGKYVPVIQKAEALRYISQGLRDTRLYGAISNYKNTPDQIDDLLAGVYAKNPLEAARLLGDIDDRGSHPTNSGSDLKNFAPELYWNSRLGFKGSPWENSFRATIQTVDELGLDPKAGQKAMKSVLSNYSAQKASEEDSGGFGDLLKVAAIATAAYFGIPALTESLGAAGATGASVEGASFVGPATGSLAPGIAGVSEVFAVPSAYSAAATTLSASQIASAAKTGFDVYSLSQKLGAKSSSVSPSAYGGTLSTSQIAQGLQNGQLQVDPKTGEIAPVGFYDSANSSVNLQAVILGAAALVAIFVFAKGK